MKILSMKLNDGKYVRLAHEQLFGRLEVQRANDVRTVEQPEMTYCRLLSLSLHAHVAKRVSPLRG